VLGMCDRRMRRYGVCFVFKGPDSTIQYEVNASSGTFTFEEAGSNVGESLSHVRFCVSTTPSTTITGTTTTTGTTGTTTTTTTGDTTVTTTGTTTTGTTTTGTIAGTTTTGDTTTRYFLLQPPPHESQSAKSTELRFRALLTEEHPEIKLVLV
jgi:hypothetical protein